MRELACLASGRGYTQQSLARALDATPPAVARYFTAERPQQSTVDRLVGLLGMTHQHVRIVQREQLEPDELIEAERDLVIEVKRSGLFTANAVATIREHLKQSPPDTRTNAITEYLLARHRVDCGIPPSVDPSGISSALRAFGDALGHRFDLLSLLRPADEPHETLLLDMYQVLTDKHDLQHAQADNILAVVRAALRLTNAPVARMDERLQSLLEYRAGEFQMKTLSNINKRRSTKKASKDQEL